MTSHYYTAAFSPRHVLFTSRWGECLIYDRKTRVSYYDHDDTSATTVERLAKTAREWFDHECAALIEGAGHLDALPPSVAAWFQTQGDRS